MKHKKNTPADKAIANLKMKRMEILTKRILDIMGQKDRPVNAPLSSPPEQSKPTKKHKP